MAITNQGNHKIKPSTAISVAILGSFVNQPAIWSCAFLHLDLVIELIHFFSKIVHILISTPPFVNRSYYPLPDVYSRLAYLNIVEVIYD